jgi:hypothetical protein
MAYNEKLANQVREMLAHVPELEEKLMFRSLTFMVNRKMCICVGEDNLLCRIDPAIVEPLLESTRVRQMIHNGRIMKGYVYVDQEAVEKTKDLNYWVSLCLAFNTVAKASIRRKKTTR